MIAGDTDVTRQSTLFSSQIQEAEDQREDIDYKMVTLSLGGKDYGVDIMKVKEIAKFESFTYVPNTQPFVRGVYNLRGDIISVIDLRTMFGLPAEQRPAGQPEDGLILRLETGLIGVIVDSIDKVVGISSESIQPPHPIFADVNIKYISGVVEHDSLLYIILDVERILGASEEEEPESGVASGAPRATDVPAQSDTAAASAGAESAEAAASPSQSVSSEPQAGSAVAGGPSDRAEFVAPTLSTLSGFTMTEINREWVEQRVGEWAGEHGGTVEITTQDEVDEFLSTFFSPFTGRFWEEDYLNALRSLLPEQSSQLMNVWNPGSGQGYEAYSIACLLRSVYPDARLKVWAGDNDLLSVSTAPNLVVDKRAVPAFYEPWLVEGSNGYSFTSEIKDLILFEFSDVVHASAVPPCDLIVIRDVLSFLSERNQRRVVEMIEEKAKADTVIVTGTNEDLLPFGSFAEISRGAVRAFRVG